MPDWFPLVATVVGIVAGGIVTFVSSRSQLRRQAEHAYDLALRDLRLPHYQALFHLTRNIPRQSVLSQDPDQADLVRFRKQFHDWYFGEQAGGLFLSVRARDAYFALQNELESAVAVKPDFPSIRTKASDLRHQLAADLGTAQEPRARWLTPRSIPPPG